MELTGRFELVSVGSITDIVKHVMPDADWLFASGLSGQDHDDTWGPTDDSRRVFYKKAATTQSRRGRRLEGPACDECRSVKVHCTGRDADITEGRNNTWRYVSLSCCLSFWQRRVSFVHPPPIIGFWVTRDRFFGMSRCLVQEVSSDDMPARAREESGQEEKREKREKRKKTEGQKERPLSTQQ